VEEVVAFLAGNLEVHEAQTFFREDRLLTFVAYDRCPEFHGLPPGLFVAFVSSGRTSSRHFRVRSQISADEFFPVESIAHTVKGVFLLMA
jgi:hypothetical protein